MKSLILTLYSRTGCCLCEGLEQNLKSISLKDLTPPLELHVVDIDSDVMPKSERNSLNLRVPVMVIYCKESQKRLELPRVSPRIQNKELFAWMQKTIKNLLESL